MISLREVRYQSCDSCDDTMQHGNSFRRRHEGKGGGRGLSALPQQRTEVQVITNRWRLAPIPSSSSQDNESSDYIQYRVTIKNGWYKRIISNEGTTTAGEEEKQRVFESKEISIKDMFSSSEYFFEIGVSYKSKSPPTD